MKSNSGINSEKQRGRVENLRAHQYKPGQSGNPKGRPPTKGLAARLKVELGQVTQGNVLIEERIARKLVRLAIRGNLAAIRECFDRTEGKPTQQLNWNDITKQLQGRSNEELIAFAKTGKWPEEEQTSD